MIAPGRSALRVHWRRLHAFHAAPVLRAEAEASTLLDRARTGLKTVGCASKAAANRIEAAFGSLPKYIEHKEAVALRAEAFYRGNRLIILAALGSGASLLLWRVIADGSFGILVFAASSAFCTGLALRARYTINPDAVYGVALRMLKDSPAVLEVLGNPVVGNKVCAYITSGGSLKFRNLRPKLSCCRCFLTFPVNGYERSGMVSSEVIKEKGKYHVKFLAVDVPLCGGAEERFYVVGKEHSVADLLEELKAPALKAVAAKQELDVLDDAEAQERRRLQLSKFLSVMRKSSQWLRKQVGKRQMSSNSHESWRKRSSGW